MCGLRSHGRSKNYGDRNSFKVIYKPIYTVYIYKMCVYIKKYEDSARLCREHAYGDHSWGCLPQPGTKRRGKRILRMEDAGTSEEEDTDSQDSNVPIDHCHLVWNYLIKIITLVVKALVISNMELSGTLFPLSEGEQIRLTIRVLFYNST